MSREGALERLGNGHSRGYAVPRMTAMTVCGRSVALTEPTLECPPESSIAFTPEIGQQRSIN